MPPWGVRIAAWRRSRLVVRGRSRWSALGELDMSNVEVLNGALKIALSDETTSWLLDLSGLDFLDSTVIKALVRWSNARS